DFIPWFWFLATLNALSLLSGNGRFLVGCLHKDVQPGISLFYILFHYMVFLYVTSIAFPV
ncbi:MAG: hypothetical protein M3Z24_10615, partial [Chloroflexota bacterium]|nr:hypothetical protein [Chloroflexota bacterium]